MLGGELDSEAAPSPGVKLKGKRKAGLEAGPKKVASMGDDKGSSDQDSPLRGLNIGP